MDYDWVLYRRNQLFFSSIYTRGNITLKLHIKIETLSHHHHTVQYVLNMAPQTFIGAIYVDAHIMAIYWTTLCIALYILLARCILLDFSKTVLVWQYLLLPHGREYWSLQYALLYNKLRNLLKKIYRITYIVLSEFLTRGKSIAYNIKCRRNV